MTCLRDGMLGDVIDYLFGAAAFVPHGYCLLWRPDLVALHAVSDLLIALSYFTIPAGLIVVVRRRRDLQFGWIFWMFAGFITACGLSHLAGLVTLWQPYYGLQGLIKAATALVSVATAVAIWPLIPKVLAVPSTGDLRQAYDALEARVAARTRDLALANERLAVEVEERRGAEADLRGLTARLAEEHALLERRVAERTADLARSKDAAEAGERAKSRFMAAMSHEIRTPMTAVLGMIDLLIEEPLTAKGRDYASAIRRSGEQLLAIINDILDFIKMGGDSLRLAEEDFDLETLVEQIQSIMRPQAAQKGLSLGVETDEAASRPLKGDPRRLKQVLFNLVGNAIKFTPKGGIVLRARGTPSPNGAAVRVRVEVEDTGVGFGADGAAGLFDPFVQGEAGALAAVGGTGLGLAISKDLVAAMGGRIGCEGRPEGGSLFWIEIDLPPGAPPRARAPVSPPASRPLRVLVAEDAPLNQELLTELLTRAGHGAVMTSNGEEALARAMAEPFDVLLFDIGMPVMDGESAIRAIRAAPGPNADTPAIVLTANVVDSDRQRYLAGGFDAFLTKPIEYDALFATLRRLGGEGSERE